MKKIMLFTILLCIFLVCMPMTTSVSMTNLKQKMPQSMFTKTEIKVEKPIWAQGYFNGTWAYDFLGTGTPWPPLGELTGYYSIGYHFNTRLGHFLVDFAYYNGDDAARSEGWFFGSYLVGKVWKTEDAVNQTSFVGIGQYNETSSEFVWRLMSFRGPTYYMWGNSAKFN